MIRIKPRVEPKDPLTAQTEPISYQPTKKESENEAQLKDLRDKVLALQSRLQEAEKEITELRKYDSRTKPASNGDISIPSTAHTGESDQNNQRNQNTVDVRAEQQQRPTEQFTHIRANSVSNSARRPIKIKMGQNLTKQEVQQQQHNITENNRPPNTPPPIITAHSSKPTASQQQSGWLHLPNNRQAEMPRYSPIYSQNQRQPTPNRTFPLNLRPS